MITRSELRKQSESWLNSLSRAELFENYRITRIGNVTGLDVLGVPVYTACRPASKTVSINAGKSLDPKKARAGAIAEAIEFATFENPASETIFYPTPDLDFPLAKDSEWVPGTLMWQEWVTRYSTGKDELFPSSLIWMVRPEPEPNYFQKSSNGQSLGRTLHDAFLQAVYECVERDQAGLRYCSILNLDVWPQRVEFDHEVTDRCRAAGLKPYFFHCAVDIDLAVYWCIILDPAWRACGGYGCHSDPAVAAERAILEAIQSRGVCIAGARDDLERRGDTFDDQKALLERFESMPVWYKVPKYGIDESVGIELADVLRRLGKWREKIYYKHIDLGEIHAVKVVVLGFEQPRLRHWRSTRWHKLHAQYSSAQACTV